MWYTWTTLLLVSCALVGAAEVGAGTEAVTESTTESPKPVATTRAPHRTLDRQAYELAWKSWLQSPDSGNQNAPPRRITTKSLFITPLNCDKGQRLDGNGCIQVVTVNRDEHERILLEELSARFTAAPPNDAIIYDYGEDEPGPLQLSIPIGLDPQAAPLQGQESNAQAQEQQPSFVKVKKDDNKPDGDASIEAELELLQLQNSHKNPAPIDGTNALNPDVMTTFPEKPKRDTPNITETEIAPNTNTTDEGQKELVYGHVNVDPILYKTENEYHNAETAENKNPNNSQPEHNNATSINSTTTDQNVNATQVTSSSHVLKKDGDQTKLNPENDYSDIGEAIKLISRYAEVTTDDNFTKSQKDTAMREDNVLGTRTRLQHRRIKPKLSEMVAPAPIHAPLQLAYKGQTPTHTIYPKNGVYYRYPWPSQHSQTPPPDYPFRHLQDYWPGRNQIGGVYNTHENPRRHHHSYPHNARPHTYPLVYPGAQAYPEQLKGYIRRMAQHHVNPMRSHTNNQDLYSLLGLRHWFSSEGTSKR